MTSAETAPAGLPSPIASTASAGAITVHRVSPKGRKRRKSDAGEIILPS